MSTVHNKQVNGTAVKNILFLSDQQPDNFLDLSEQLLVQGFRVDNTLIGGHSETYWVDHVRNRQPDVVMLEVGPQNCKSFYSLCRKLRYSSQTEHIPILVMESETERYNSPSAHYLVECLNHGATYFINAPYVMAEVISKINASLRLKASLSRAKELAEQLNAMNEELYQRNTQVEKELYMARQLQQSLLPPVVPASADEDADNAPMFSKRHYQDDKVKVSGIYLPCDALGGDLYDVLKFKDNALGISITDVSGHGVAAGFITAIFKTSLYRITHQDTNPSQVMYHLNNELSNIVKTGDYVTSLYTHLDLDTMELTCAGAGHPYPVYYNAETGTITRLENNGPPLVWVKNMDYPLDTLKLNPGDKLFLFTDGVSELKNPQNELFNEERLCEVLLKAIQSGKPNLLDTIIETLSDFSEGNPIEDDISMVLIETV